MNDVIIEKLGRGQLAAFMLSLITAIWLMDYSLENKHREQDKQLVVSELNSLTELLQHELDNISTSLSRMTTRWVAENGTPEDLWFQDASAYYYDTEVLKAVEWINPDMIVSWVEPLKGNESASGFDLSSESTIATVLIDAKSLRRTIFSPVIDLVQGNQAVFLVSPILLKDRFDGWLLALIDADQLMSRYAKLWYDRGYQIAVHQADGKALFSSMDAVDGSDQITNKILSIPGQDWQISLKKDTGRMSLLGYLISRATSLFSLFLSFALVVMWRMIHKQKIQAEYIQQLFTKKETTMNAVRDGILVFSSSGMVEDFNEIAIQQFKLSAEEIVSNKITSLLCHGESLRRSSEAFTPMSFDDIIGKNNEKEIIFGLRSDGYHFPISTKIKSCRLNGALVYVATIQDLSSKIALESNLDATEKMFDISIQNATSGFAIQDSFGNYVEVNRAFCDILGYTKKELESLSAIDITPTEKKEEITELIRKLRHGEVEKFSIEKQYLCKDGSSKWCLVSQSSVKNSDGDTSTIVASVVDINEQKKLELELRESQEFLQLIMNNIKDLIFVKDESFRIQFANHAFLSLYPEDVRDHIIGTTTLEKYNEEEVELFTKQDRIAFETGISETTEQITFPNGEERTLFTTKQCFHDESHKKLILGVARDITEENNLIEKLTASNHDLEQFAYFASHDLKAPLEAIRKLIVWIEEDAADSLPEDSRHHFKLIKNRADRMKALLLDLLQYSRISRVESDFSEFSMKEVVSDIVDLIGVPDKFSVDIDEAQLCLPRTPFETVMRNVISNAVKHHDKESGRISVTFKKSDKNIIIVVADDGPGVPKEYQTKILEMFQTLRPRDEVEGSGMGLAIVNRLMKHITGRLLVVSDGERGTEIHLFWPIKPVQNERTSDYDE